MQRPSSEGRYVYPVIHGDGDDRKALVERRKFVIEYVGNLLQEEKVYRSKS